MSQDNLKTTPAYESPPLTEVVCGVQFDELKDLLAAHIGLLWSAQFQKDYPRLKEVPPLSPVIESFQDTPRPRKLEFSEKPPLPRTWFISENENLLIQVQRDRFIHNWRKVLDDDAYPRYPKVFSSFRTCLTTFLTFVEKMGIGPICNTQYELTYTNLIGSDEKPALPGAIGEYFRDMNWQSTSRTLPEPESVHATYTFVFPEDRMRLHSVVRTANRVHDGSPVFRLELTARGIPENTESDAMPAWFDAAHRRIVTAFSDLTEPLVQDQLWRRLK